MPKLSSYRKAGSTLAESYKPLKEYAHRQEKKGYTLEQARLTQEKIGEATLFFGEAVGMYEDVKWNRRMKGLYADIAKRQQSLYDTWDSQFAPFLDDPDKKSRDKIRDMYEEGTPFEDPHGAV